MGTQTPAKPRLFISHSCKDFADDQALPAPVAAQLQFARWVRDALKAALEGEFEILLDVDGLGGGDDWRAELHHWLGLCDAAVILFNDEALASDWVRQEATILCWRKSLDDRLRLVPVFLGDFDPARLARNQFGDTDLLRQQGERLRGSAAQRRQLSLANARSLAQQVAQRLRQPCGAAAAPRPPEMARWVEDVRLLLANVRDTDGLRLDGARRALGISDRVWAQFNQHPALLASELLTAEFGRIHDALLPLRPPALLREDFEALLALLAPVWVDATAARTLVRPAGEAPAQRIFALNSAEDDTPRDYVNRAWCCPPWQRRIVHYNQPAGEGQANEVPDRLARALKTALTNNPDCKDALLQLRLQGDPVVVMLGDQVPVNATLLSSLSQRFPGVTYLVPAGTDFERLGGGTGTGALAIEPRLAPDQELRQLDRKLRITQDLLPPPST